MQITRILNNNVVQAETKDHKEYVVMGKGIGFQRQLGDSIQDEQIEKRFVLEDNSFFSQLYQDLTTNEIELIFKIIKQAEERLGVRFENNLYVTLADHIHYALARYQEGIHLKNPLHWQVKRLFKLEYQTGLEAVEMINQIFNISLPEGEASSIALHLINAQKEGDHLEQTMEQLRMIERILSLIRLHYGRDFDENSISFQRFMTHLQYFVQRLTSEDISAEGDSFLNEQVQASYPKAYQTALKIREFIDKQYHREVGIEEVIYLTIHIQRLMKV
ncbi:BglG family transcription antiterminator LicT [Aerococcus loyolae]|uniref:PRD domain-containing protein n=1 Tax=Aerococcus loyolae TaxID=2976809 RepID=A0ABT4C079_9LACT|nr:PRD domain-containing protein [Aerococcus loyolae]MCY3024936.1 PRD domain-containing protein [Aerococcus loyolae]MCY3027008.1 PRD domain-containing protein [Aerococcus loyolae]MCY3028592.1 PRD domain-containing protein [Aerococcus loyolae]OAM70546.1 hypothetical protein A1D21_02775 [Aerococcus loyolae]